MCELSHIGILLILLRQNHQPIGHYRILGILLVVCVSILQLKLLLRLCFFSMIYQWYDLELLMIHSIDFFSAYIHQLLFFLLFQLLSYEKLRLHRIFEILFLLLFILPLDEGLLLFLRQPLYLLSYFLLWNLVLCHRAMLLEVLINPSLIQFLERLCIIFWIFNVWARLDVLGIK